MTVTDAVHASVLDDFLNTLKSVDKASFNDDGERGKALLAAYALISRLERPWETVCRLTMAQASLDLLSSFFFKRRY